MEETSNTLLIFNPIDVKKTELKVQAFEPTKIPLDILKHNMERVFDQIGSMFKDAQNKLDNCRMESVDIDLGITGEGSIGIFGTGIKGSANAGITVHLIFTDKDAIHKNDV